jgi:hypothetical protein
MRFLLLPPRVFVPEVLQSLFFLAALLLLPRILALLALVVELCRCLSRAQADSGGERRPGENAGGGSKKVIHETPQKNAPRTRLHPAM